MQVNRNMVSVVVLLTVIILITWGVELRSSSPVDEQLEELVSQIRAEAWAEAAKTVEGLERAWLKRRFWLALNNSVQDQLIFERTLEQVRVYVDLQDLSSAAAYTALLRRIWYEFGR